MAKMTKNEVIAKLEAAAIAYNADAKYDDLCKLLPQNEIEAPAVEAPVKVPEKLLPLTAKEQAQMADIARRANLDGAGPAADDMMILGRLRARAKANEQPVV
jgi:hypothetical protein